jgi:hypothetical protein
MARAVTWSYDPDYSWDHESPIPRRKETLMTIIVHPSMTGKKEINASHPGEFKQMDLFHNSSSDQYYFETITAKRKGKVIK